MGNALTSEHHPMIGLAKDAAAGAVLIAALGALLVGILVFAPRLLGVFA
jgi:diacylglycerol kinase (ATP)